MNGCGFPIIRCVMLFCLATGAVLNVAMAPYRGKETGENSLLQTIIGLLFAGEILLADRYYATFANIHRAYREGYDVVMRVHHKRKVDFRKGYKQGPCDQIVAYAKPANRPVWMSAEEYDDLEAFVLVRHLRYAVHQKGFRVRYLVLATTLLNAFSEKLQAGCDRLAALEDALLESISEHPVGDRKPRIHPREIKRRPKQYKFMNRPRPATRRSAA